MVAWSFPNFFISHLLEYHILLYLQPVNVFLCHTLDNKVNNLIVQI